MSTWYQRWAFSMLRAGHIRRLLRRYSVSFTGDLSEPDAPYLFVSNHQHMADSYILAARMADPVMGMADHEASELLQRIGGKILGLYFRRPGIDDTAVIRKTRELLSAGHNVGIFPSGAMSWTGRDEINYLQTAKLAKILRVPLRIARIRGLYLAGPRWAESPRRCPVTVELSRLSADEIREPKAADLAALLEHRMAHDEVRDLRGYDVRGKNLAAGIHNIIWRCPSCGTQDSMYGSADRISCRACSEEWNLRGDLTIGGGGFSDIIQWHDWQCESLVVFPFGHHAEVSPITTENAELKIVPQPGAKSAGADGKAPASGSYRGVSVLQGENSIELALAGRRQWNLPLQSIRAARVLKNRSFCFSHANSRYRLTAPGVNLLKWLRLWERAAEMRRL